MWDFVFFSRWTQSHQLWHLKPLTGLSLQWHQLLLQKRNKHNFCLECRLSSLETDSICGCSSETSVMQIQNWLYGYVLLRKWCWLMTVEVYQRKEQWKFYPLNCRKEASNQAHTDTHSCDYTPAEHKINPVIINCCEMFCLMAGCLCIAVTSAV